MKVSTLTTRVRIQAISRSMEPREFCRNWLNATPEDEQQWGYRQKCVRLLSQITGVKEDTINNKWGKG